MDPITTGITYTAMGGGASAGAAGGGAAAGAMANPLVALILAAALGTAYGVSPTVRKKTNKVVKQGYEAFTNPFQHFGDGSEKDTLSHPALFGRLSDLGGEGGGPGSLGNLGNLLKPGQQDQQKKQNRQQNDDDPTTPVNRFLSTLASQANNIGYFDVPGVSQFKAPEPKYLVSQPLQTPQLPVSPFNRRQAYGF